MDMYMDMYMDVLIYVHVDIWIYGYKNKYIHFHKGLPLSKENRLAILLDIVW
jgi:hypothetical protein